MPPGPGRRRHVRLDMLDDASDGAETRGRFVRELERNSTQGHWALCDEFTLINDLGQQGYYGGVLCHTLGMHRKCFRFYYSRGFRSSIDVSARNWGWESSVR